MNNSKKKVEMNDNDYLDHLMSNMKTEMSKLNEFESAVMARPRTDEKRALLQAINLNRDKLAELAKAVVLARSG